MAEILRNTDGLRTAAIVGASLFALCSLGPDIADTLLVNQAELSRLQRSQAFEIQQLDPALQEHFFDAPEAGVIVDPDLVEARGHVAQLQEEIDDEKSVSRRIHFIAGLLKPVSLLVAATAGLVLLGNKNEEELEIIKRQNQFKRPR